MRQSLLSVLIVVLMVVGVDAEGPYEEPPILLRATDAAPAELLKGEHHEVRNGVENDGYMNNYVIETEFGLFEAEGNFQLRKRLSEIEAIAQLQQVTRTQAFTDALEASATKQYRAAEQAIKNPVETAKGIPGGVSRLVKRTARKVGDLSEEVQEEYTDYKQDKAEEEARKAEREAERAAAEARGETVPEPEQEPAITSEEAKEVAAKGAEYGEDYAKKWLGYTQNRRKWSRQLGVDPYSDNDVLNKELHRVAQASAAGSVTMKLVPVPRFGVLGDLKDVSQLVWAQDPLDLRMRNEKILYGMGVTEEQVEAMYENRYQTPTSTTFLTSALERLGDVEERHLFIERASEVESRAHAEFVVRAATFLASYHEESRRLVRLGQWIYPVPQGVTEDGRLVTPLPVDRLHWTRDVGTLLEGRVSEARADTGAATIELWISGGLSDRAREALEELGIEIYPDSFKGVDTE